VPGKLSITVGLPGSGKTTEAIKIKDADPEGVVLASRDGLRELLYNEEGICSSPKENHITKVQKDIVKSGLKAGKHVVVHDMNLRPKYRKQWAEIARDLGAEFNIIDCTQVDEDECFYRDYDRGNRGERSVGEKVIRDLAKKFKNELKADTWKPYKLYPAEAFQTPVSYELYVPDLTKPKAIIVDIDGTVADCKDIRSPYDYSRVRLDRPKHQVIKLVQEAAYVNCYKIIFVSGRLAPEGSECYKDTEEWLYNNVKVPIEHLYTRQIDRVDDTVVKADIFNKYIRDNYNIQYVLDDRNRVVEMWRSMGLLTLQVAEGDF